MPPKRPTRAAASKAATTAKPTSKPAAKATTRSLSRPAAKGRSKTAKRPASPERSPSRPAKRSRPLSKLPSNEAVPPEEEADKAPAKKAAKPAAPRGRKAAKPAEPESYFNPLPAPAEHIRPTPRLYVWGAGNFGQFGMGPDVLDELSKPRNNTWIEKKVEEGVFGGEDAGLEAIAAGGLYSLFIDEKGTVWSCGTNDDAALGRTTTNVPDPDKPGEFLDADTLTSFPYPLDSLVEEGFRAVRIAAGDSVSAAISDKGELRAWGHFRSAEGALGFSSGHKHQVLPAPILELKNEKSVAVAAGNNHLLVLTTHGNIYTWGVGESGQLGRKILERRKIHGTVPEKVVLGNRSRKAVVVGAGNYTSFAVDDKGDVWAWGLNNYGQTGTGFVNEATDGQVERPTKVVALSAAEFGDDEKVVEISGGEHHTLFLTSKGRVFAVGRTDGSQVGLPPDHEALKDREFGKMLTEPTEVKFPDEDEDERDPIVHISAGIHHNLAASKAGALFSWGTGPQGELGAGDEESELKTPKMIVRREGGSWATLTVSAGGQHSLALLKKKSSS